MTERGPEEWFSGVVWIDAIADAPEPSRLHVSVVTFEPGSRTAWHEHPLGQVLYATQGLGLVRIGDEPARYLRPGDAVVVPPLTRHWHGSAPGYLFVHVAIQEAAPDGGTATWYEHVDAVEYLAASLAQDASKRS